MAVKIGHASIDENGRIVGGKVGDQTGKEICIREWYKKPWNVMLICTDEKIADKAADYMETICKNDNYGYDQGQRTTGYTSIKKNGVAKGKGEFDCSSLIASCYNLAGLDVNVNCTTRNLRKALLATGKFKAYENAAHIKTSDYELLCAMYLSEDNNKVIALGKVIKQLEKETQNASDYGSRYKVTADMLNVRKGPGTKYRILKVLRKGAEVKISEKQDEWGKYSEGWISLKYAKKV